MSNHWFIGDTHFGHHSMLLHEHCWRKYHTIEERDEAIITTWNTVVHRKDIVWHLGDFAYRCDTRRVAEIAVRLHGRKRIILGNHDNLGPGFYPKYFEEVHGTKFMQVHVGDKKHRVILTHMPVHPYNFPRAIANIHGHTHSRRVQCPLSMGDDPRYINVCMEAWGTMGPIPIDSIRSRLEALLEDGGETDQPLSVGDPVSWPSRGETIGSDDGDVVDPAGIDDWSLSEK